METYTKNQQGGKRDYHKNFNGSNFVAEFGDFLLRKLNQPSLIIIDNTRYHKTRSVGTPVRSKMRKGDATSKLEELGIQFEEGISASEAKELLRNWI